MLHPHTELRFVSEEIGYGVFATQDIPKGTIMWVRDELDRTFTPLEAKSLSPANYENLMKYTYRDRHGHYFFCWDLNRYVNHSYVPNSMLTSMGFEIATRDIKKGEELLNDYGTFNVDEPFKCATGPHLREQVLPDDLILQHKKWDTEVSLAMEWINKVNQPLKAFLTADQDTRIARICSGEEEIPSVLENHYKDR